MLTPALNPHADAGGDGVPSTRDQGLERLVPGVTVLDHAPQDVLLVRVEEAVLPAAPVWRAAGVRRAAPFRSTVRRGRGGGGGFRRGTDRAWRRAAVVFAPLLSLVLPLRRRRAAVWRGARAQPKRSLVLDVELTLFIVAGAKRRSGA